MFAHYDSCWSRTRPFTTGHLRNLPGNDPRLLILLSQHRQLIELIAGNEQSERDPDQRQQGTRIEPLIQKNAADNTKDDAHHNRAAKACCDSGCSNIVIIDG